MSWEGQPNFTSPLNGTGEFNQLPANTTAPWLAELGYRIVGVALMFCGTLGNSLMIYVIRNTAYLRTVTNDLLLNLAVVDLGVSVVAVPAWLITSAVGGSLEGTDYLPYLCDAVGFVTYLLLLVSVATVSGISLDRYLSVCHPLEYPRKVTRKRIYVLLIVIWIHSLFLSGLPLVGWGGHVWRPHRYPMCGLDVTSHFSYFLFLGLLGLGMPLSITTYSYSRIIREATKQLKGTEKMQLKLIMSSAEGQDDQRDLSRHSRSLSVSGMLSAVFPRAKSSQFPVKTRYSAYQKTLKIWKCAFTVIGTFVVCWLPHVFLNMWAITGAEGGVSGNAEGGVSGNAEGGVSGNAEGGMSGNAEALTTLLVFTNSVINPFTLIYLTRDIRFAVRMLLVKCLDSPGQEEVIQGLNSRRSSYQIESVVEGLPGSRRGSLDSGVEIDRGFDSRRHSASTICSSYIDMDEENQASFQSDKPASVEGPSGHDAGSEDGRPGPRACSLPFVPVYGATLKPPNSSFQPRSLSQRTPPNLPQSQAGGDSRETLRVPKLVLPNTTD